MQVGDRQGQIFGEGSIAIDNTQRGTVWAMGGHATLTIETIWTRTGGVDFAYDALAHQGERCTGTRAFMHSFNDANKFMPQDALEGHIATSDLYIGIADTCLYNFYQSFPWLHFRSPIVLLKR